MSRKQKAEATRAELVEIAYRIVREEGVQALSSTRIIQRSAISQGGFFHHFPQMQDLYLHMLDLMIQGMESDLNPSQFRTFPALVRASADYTMNLLENSPEVITILFVFFSQCNHNEEYRNRLKTLVEGALERWTDGCAHFFPDLSRERKNRIVRILDMYFGGLSLHYMVFRDPKTYCRITEEFAAMLINEITLNGSTSRAAASKKSRGAETFGARREDRS